MTDIDVSSNSKTTVTNPIAGIYKTRGSMYNYVGQVPWAGPAPPLYQTDSLSVPPGYISRIDLSPFSPKTATAIDSTAITIPYANSVLPTYYYFIRVFNPTYNPPYSIITFVFNPAGYSNISKFIRDYRSPLPTRKPSWRFITQFNDGPGGTGNDHIVDEVFEQQ